MRSVAGGDSPSCPNPHTMACDQASPCGWPWGLYLGWERDLPKYETRTLWLILVKKGKSQGQLSHWKQTPKDIKGFLTKGFQAFRLLFSPLTDTFRLWLQAIHLWNSCVTVCWTITLLNTKHNCVLSVPDVPSWNTLHPWQNPWLCTARRLL